MIIEEFVAALESYVRTINDSAIFILQRETEPCKFKAYKKLRYTLWYIDKSRDKRFPIYTIQSTFRITSSEEEETATREVNLKFMADIFEFIRGEKFKLILGGSYDVDELVPDLDNGWVTKRSSSGSIGLAIWHSQQCWVC